MGFFDFLKTATEDSFNFHVWWLSEFSEEERAYINNKYYSADLNKIQSVESPECFLKNLCGWFTTMENSHLGWRIAKKAEYLALQKKSIVDLHFIYAQMLKQIHRYHEKIEDETQMRIEICKKQIALSLQVSKIFKKEFSEIPAHSGYFTLISILKDQGRRQEAKELILKQKKEGWA